MIRAVTHHRLPPHQPRLAIVTCRGTWNIRALATNSTANACSKITFWGRAQAFHPTQASSSIAGRPLTTHPNEASEGTRKAKIAFCTKKIKSIPFYKLLRWNLSLPSRKKDEIEYSSCKLMPLLNFWFYLWCKECKTRNGRNLNFVVWIPKNRYAVWRRIL